MSKKNKDIKKNVLSKFRKNVDKWKNVYNLFGIVILVIAAIIAFSNLNTAKNAIQQTQKSINITLETLEINKKLFKMEKDVFCLRNRPFVAIRDFKFAGPFVISGKHFEHSITFSMSNISSIPATSMIIQTTVFIDNKLGRKTIFGTNNLLSKIGLVSLPPDSNLLVSVGLTKKEYETVKTASKDKHKIEIEISYNGMLGTPEDKYKMTYIGFYDSKNNKFRTIESSL